MMKWKQKSDARKPVARVVHAILEQVKVARADGPSSGLYSRDAQLSGALTQAGTLLARLDKSAPGKGPSFGNLFGLLAAPPPKPKRRSWLFAGAPASMPDAKKIDQLLRAAMKDGRPLVLEQIRAGDPSLNNDLNCTLPAGAVDPVCEPR